MLNTKPNRCSEDLKQNFDYFVHWISTFYKWDYLLSVRIKSGSKQLFANKPSVNKILDYQNKHSLILNENSVRKYNVMNG